MPLTLIHRLPDAPLVARTLSDLNGKPARCVAFKPAAPAAFATQVVGRYVGPDGQLAALLLADVPLAASLGAALVMLPPVVVQECIDRGRIDDNVAENLREVLNVCAGLFNSAATPRVKLADLATVTKLPDQVAAFAKAATGRLDVDVTVPGYPGGKMTLMTR
jgi:hypothetical protein